MSYRLYHTKIEQGDRHDRRSRERDAVMRLVRHAFGPDAVLTHDPDGAPRIEGLEGEWFSISHSADNCILAVTRKGRIGVDTETARAQLVRVAPRFLAPCEAVSLDIGYLLRMWTAKEAVYKAAGMPGLGLDEIVVSDGHAQARGIRFSLDYPLLTPGRVTAVAVCEP